MPTTAATEYPQRPDTTTSTRSELLRAALAYAARGWRVFPLNGKVPYAKTRGYLDATTDPAHITGMFNARPSANVGIATGRGLLVLDMDPDKWGAGTLDALEAEHGELPPTYTVKSGRGGLHFYFSLPPGVEVRNSAGKLGPGLDTRADGGYVVAAPSATVGRYTVLENRPLAPAPEWLITALADSPENLRSPGPVPLDASGTIPEGRRNWTLYRRGCSLRARGYEHAAILEALQRENAQRCKPPLESGEVERIAASAARHAPGSATGGRDPKTLEALEHIEAELWRREWPGMAGKTDRDVMVALVKEARKHATLIPAGVRVSLSVRGLALAAAVSKPTAIKAIRRLREAGLIRKDDAGRSGTEAGAFVLLPPRASLYHSATQSFARGRERASGKDLRAPYTAARLRWSAPEIRRLGKTRGAVVDRLEAAGGSMGISELAAALKVKRLRDFRRRVLPALEAAGVVRVLGDTVALTLDWLSALDTDRERAGEIEAEHRDRKHYRLERDAYRNRHRVKPEPVPVRTVAQLERVPEPPDPWKLYARVGEPVQTRHGPGLLWQAFGDRVGVVLDSAPAVVTFMEPHELLLESAA